MGKGNLLGLAHIGVFVRDMDASIDFYKRLGFTLDNAKETNTGVKISFLSAGSCVLELIGRNVEPYRTAGIVDHIAIQVDDMEAAIAKANANGIEIDASKVGNVAFLGNVSNVFFTGPDGERLEFFCNFD